MPYIWAHLIFGQEVIKAVEKEDWLNQPKLRKLFNLGCQGPDILFYHNFWPWQRDKKMTTLGSAMHSKQCGPLLLELVQSVHGHRLDDPKVIYVLGFLMHHVLDRNLHPYVFYRSGFRKWDHQYFEVAMDTLIARRKLGIETWQTPVLNEISVGAELPPFIAPMFVKATSQLYPELTANISESDWRKSYRDMLLAQKIFHDPSGLKRRLTFNQIDPMVYKRKLTHHDYLNEARTEWRHPALEDHVSNLSFWDMWDPAREDGNQVMRAAIGYLIKTTSDEQEKAYKDLKAVVGNRSYETGLSCENNAEIRFSDPNFW